jgi:hypothetical protein
MTPPDDDLAGVDDLVAEVARALVTAMTVAVCASSTSSAALYRVHDDGREHYATRSVTSAS